uniref:Uncharacterized protein n=1 Tax=Anguilla anguilla TaxID=7936 RepID=A0A0E9PB23_ANGAN
MRLRLRNNRKWTIR